MKDFYGKKFWKIEKKIFEIFEIFFEIFENFFRKFFLLEKFRLQIFFFVGDFSARRAAIGG